MQREGYSSIVSHRDDDMDGVENGNCGIDLTWELLLR